MNLKLGCKATLITSGIGVAVLLGWLATSQTAGQFVHVALWLSMHNRGTDVPGCDYLIHAPTWDATAFRTHRRTRRWPGPKYRTSGIC